MTYLRHPLVLAWTAIVLALSALLLCAVVLGAHRHPSPAPARRDDVTVVFALRAEQPSLQQAAAAGDLPTLAAAAGDLSRLAASAAAGEPTPGAPVTVAYRALAADAGALAGSVDRATATSRLRAVSYDLDRLAAIVAGLDVTLPTPPAQTGTPTGTTSSLPTAPSAQTLPATPSIPARLRPVPTTPAVPALPARSPLTLPSLPAAPSSDPTGPTR